MTWDGHRRGEDLACMFICVNWKCTERHCSESHFSTAASALVTGSEERQWSCVCAVVVSSLLWSQHHDYLDAMILIMTSGAEILGPSTCKLVIFAWSRSTIVDGSRPSITYERPHPDPVATRASGLVRSLCLGSSALQRPDQFQRSIAQCANASQEPRDLRTL